MNGSLYPLVRILTVYIEALKELSYVYSPEGLNTTLLNKAESFQTVPLWEWWAQRTVQDRGGGEEPVTAWSQLRGQPVITSSS